VELWRGWFWHLRRMSVRCIMGHFVGPSLAFSLRGASPDLAEVLGLSQSAVRWSLFPCALGERWVRHVTGRARQLSLGAWLGAVA